MQAEAPRPRREPSLGLLRWLVAGAFSDLAALLALVLAHGFVPAPSLVVAAGALTWALAALAGGSLVLGAYWAWKTYPQHRKEVAFLVAVTLVTLGAHAYVIGTPAATSQGTVSGTVGNNFSDSYVTAGASVAGNNLIISLYANKGQNAIAQADVTYDGAPLSGGWANGQPSYSSLLEPGSSTTGTWTLPPNATAGGEVGISYQFLCTGNQGYGCIMDEVFYVPEGMGILAGQHCSTGDGAPTYCHLEHPPLVPALIASGMAIFGEYNAAGWRAMPAILGSFSVPLLFGVAWKLSENKKIAYLSATLLALDVMFFAQSGTAVLDVPEVFFGLAAFFVYFANLRVWKVDRHVLAGVFLGLAGLAKETAVFIALAFMTYLLFFEEGTRLSRVYDILKVAIVVGVVFAGGVQIYDLVLGSAPYSYFYENINYLLGYGSGLTAGCPWACGWTNSAWGGYITPLNWLTYYSPVQYFGVAVVGSVNYEAVAYYGVTNLLVSWTVYVWVPLAALSLYRYHRRSKRPPEIPTLDQLEQPTGPPEPPGETKFAGLALIVLAWGYLPYLLIQFVLDRVTYPFYIIPAIPGLAMGASYWLSRSWFPKWLVYVYLAMVFVFFLIYFPDKGFLPVWLRSLIGR